MKSLLKWLAGATAMLLAAATFAAELTLSAQEFENLGIQLASPTKTERVGGISARAKVVIPPAGEQVVSAIRAGSVVQVNVSLGDVVSQGQVLGYLQSPDFLTLQREYLDAFNTDSLARLQLDRDDQLLSEGIISKRRLEETDARAKAAAASLGEHRQMLRLSGMSDQQIAALAEQQRFTDRLAIRAPIDGVLLELMTVVGQRIDAMDPIYRIGDLSQLWLEIQVPQEQSSAVSIGMHVAILDYDGELLAEVLAVSRAVDPVTQMVTVRARLTRSDHELKPGQFLTVQLVTDTGTASTGPVWTVPTSAIVRSGQQSYVFVRTNDGFDVRAVNELSTTGNVAYINEAFSANTRIAVTGVSALKAMWAAETDT